ncbi:MAG: radical SAM family heme chaperone HemW [Fimbriimonadaceae bacterium]|nr:radical SAM family heme chaperone HemW [Fimbriimonadaceae bacterium]
MLDPIAVYVHIPFCPSKCGYCDFNSYAQTGEIQTETTHAIVREILTSPHAGRPAKTIFFGGGTPTFIAQDELLLILDAVLRTHPPAGEIEVTSEANPGTVDAAKFAAMRSAGFNRISLGAQSFVPDDLIRLERVHAADDITRAVSAARDAGFLNINLDLMFALPGQTRRGWQSNLDRALALQPDHLSLYCLTIEPNTSFYRKHLRGELNLPNDEAQVAMYEDCVRTMSTAGYEHYEISNFAKPGQECRHNLEYWRHHPYIGYGPGAVGCVPVEGGMMRYTNLKLPQRYVAAVNGGSPIPFESEVLTPEQTQLERVMLGMRLSEGVPMDWVSATGFEKVRQQGWVERADDRVRLTAAGKHYCSTVVLELC